MQRIYETDRLFLKILDRSSASSILGYYERNREFLEEWEPLRSRNFYTVRYHEEQLDNEIESIQNRSSLRLWIFSKEAPLRIIGCIGFSNIVWGAFLSCHLGYKLDYGEINRGYMTEALKKGIDIIFNEYGLHRIEANIMPRNVRSLRVAQKLGFYNEGLAYKYLKINGRWEDHIHMVLLNPREV